MRALLLQSDDSDDDSSEGEEEKKPAAANGVAKVGGACMYAARRCERRQPTAWPGAHSLAAQLRQPASH